MPRPRAFNEAAALDRAVDAFWQGGYEALPVQDLCRAMGLHPGSLYAAYGDKRALFLAALDRYVATVSAEAIERINGDPASGLAGIERYLRHLVDAILGGKRRWGCLITNTAVELSLRDAEVAEKVALHFARLETAFAAALARARAAGEVDEAAAAAAPYLACVVQGLHVAAKTRPTRERLDLIVGAALRSLRP